MPLARQDRIAATGTPGSEAQPPTPLLLALRGLAAGAPLPAELVERPPADLLVGLEREGLLPALDDSRPGAARGLPPDSELARAARSAARLAAERNLAGLATLAAVHRGLARGGVDHLAFKGPVSNRMIHGARARRLYGDLDLLVRRRDRERAAALLSELGFRRAPRAGKLAAFAQRIHFHASFGAPVGSGLLPVELHWELIDRVNLFRIDLDELFAASERLPVAGFEVPVLDLAAHFVYLCCHLGKHAPRIRWGLDAGRPADWFCQDGRGFPLAWLLDLHGFALLVAERGDPRRVERLVREWNAAAEVENAVRLLELLMPSERRAAALARLGLAPGASDRTRRPLVARALTRGGFSRGERFDATWAFRPIRFLDLPRTLLPSPRRLRAFHRDERTFLPRLYVRHVRAMLRRLLGSPHRSA